MGRSTMLEDDLGTEDVSKQHMNITAPNFNMNLEAHMHFNGSQTVRTVSLPHHLAP